MWAPTQGVCPWNCCLPSLDPANNRQPARLSLGNLGTMYRPLYRPMPGSGACSLRASLDGSFHSLLRRDLTGSNDIGCHRPHALWSGRGVTVISGLYPVAVSLCASIQGIGRGHSLGPIRLSCSPSSHTHTPSEPLTQHPQRCCSPSLHPHFLVFPSHLPSPRSALPKQEGNTHTPPPAASAA